MPVTPGQINVALSVYAHAIYAESYQRGPEFSAARELLRNFITGELRFGDPEIPDDGEPDDGITGCRVPKCDPEPDGSLGMCVGILVDNDIDSRGIKFSPDAEIRFGTAQHPEDAVVRYVVDIMKQS